MSRYKEKRKITSWLEYPRMELKALAAVVYQYEGIKNPKALDIRVWRLWPEVAPQLWEKPETEEEIKIAFNGGYTAHKLFQRVDKWRRYKEAMPTKDRVELAYVLATGKRLDVSLEQTRIPPRAAKVKRTGLFPDWMLEFWKAKQANLCYVCDRPFTETRLAVGAHVLAAKNGGTIELMNCRATCWPCNSECGTLDLMQYVKKRTLLEVRGRLR